MKEYYVKYWGQAESFLKEKLNVSELDFWFVQENERSKHIQKSLQLCKPVGTIVYSCQEGEDMNFKTVVEMKLLHKGVEYLYSYDFGYGYPCRAAEFMFLEGNYSCDCNLSSFIQEQHPNFPKLGCGVNIIIEDFKITKVKGESYEY